MEKFRESTFCFCPYGDGWGSRIVHAMASACIPVIVQVRGQRERKEGKAHALFENSPNTQPPPRHANPFLPSSPPSQSPTHPPTHPHTHMQEFVHQPFDEILHYEDFSLRLSVSDMPQLLEILKSVTDEEIQRFRKNMHEVGGSV